ncbi:hypothetical protein [Alienimonas chondri]|uniref:hypothetical protein n=1 Tax=Alienimonas chondri TaxID=2681879 RepID=UPI001489BA1C|nr:hypothetical protein [Alienimonas chondri]
MLFLLTAATVVVFPIDAEADEGDTIDTLSEVLAELRKVERRPFTGTLRWKSEYRLDGAQGGDFFLTEKTKVGVESRLTDAWRVDVKTDQTTAVGPPQGHRFVSCFDGARTVRAGYYTKDAKIPVVNLIEGESRSQEAFDPHKLAIERKAPRSTLSQWLTQELEPGDRSVAEDGFSGMTARYRGAEKIDDLPVQVVEAEFRQAGKPESEVRSRWVFFLAPDRDWLPVRAEFWGYKWTTEFPMSTFVLTDIVQTKDGRWLPREAVQEKFGEGFAQRGERKRTWREVTTVEFDPDRLIDRADLCEDVLPVDGSPVYVLEDGEIVESYVEGEQD